MGVGWGVKSMRPAGPKDMHSDTELHMNAVLQLKELSSEVHMAPLDENLACQRGCLCVYLLAFMQAGRQASMCVCVCVCVICVCDYVCVCMHAHVHTCVCVCVCMCI